MKESLFKDADGKEYGALDIKNALMNIGAHDCEGLLLHSDIMFGIPDTGFRKKEYLHTLYEIIESLNVKYLLVPTFTYSYCNHEDYDVLNSKTSMGALNEYIRKQEGRYRTLDPLLSLSVPVDLEAKFNHLSNHSLGVGSALDVIHQMDGIKFLFFGARLGNCFTYVHYLEKMLDVPYRFDMSFQGNTIDAMGINQTTTQYIHTACYGVKPADYYYFEDELQDKGMLRKQKLVNSSVACISEKDAYQEIKKKVETDINYFLEQPFTESDLEHKYTKGLDGTRITHC